VIGKHVVVTGGKGDLAVAISHEFRNAGYAVDAPGRKDLDVSDPAAVCGYFENRCPDVLICCAGVTHDALLARMSSEDWDRVWQTNYAGAKRCADAVLPSMSRKGRGHVIFISSHSALHPPMGQSAYAAAKRALLGLTQELADTCGPSGLRVNAVLPGFLDNRMTRHLSSARKAEVLREHALGRLNTVSDVARFLRFLHESMPHTSGQWFQLDSRPMRQA